MTQTIEVRGVRYKLHPACVVFPEMTGEELVALVEDVREHGLRVPIVRHRDHILDGRNRLKACAAAGVAPEFVEWDGAGGSPTRYVMSLNLHRRSLTPSQRAAIGAEIRPLFEAEAAERKAKTQAKAGNDKAAKNGKNAQKNGEPKFRLTVFDEGRKSADDAAEAAGASRANVEAADRIKRADPEAFEAVKSGRTTVHAATKAIKAKADPKPRGVDTTDHREAMRRLERIVALTTNLALDYGLSSPEAINVVLRTAVNGRDFAMVASAIAHAANILASVSTVATAIRHEPDVMASSAAAAKKGS